MPTKADDLVLVAETVGNLDKTFKMLKQNLESGSFGVIFGKTKGLVNRREDGTLIQFGK